MGDGDYIVIGAGFAGLAAALRLTQAGHSVPVMEARERPGGRTFTGCAHRVRARAPAAMRAYPLGGYRDVGGDVRLR
jgi:monoamine oxidase